MKKSLLEYPWNNREFVGNYLAQTYHYVYHSEKLLSLCVVRLNDPKLIKRFKAHLLEEDSHEQLALRDINKLGFNLLDFPQLVETKNFYETQYYKIDYIHPLAIMGYIHFLEQLAAQSGTGIYRLIEEGIQFKSSFLKVHGEEDIKHVVEARRMIEALPDDLQVVVEENYRQSERNFYALLDSIVISINTSKKIAA